MLLGPQGEIPETQALRCHSGGAAAGVTSLAELPVELREIRLKMRARAESLGTRLILANLPAGPLLVQLFRGLVTRLRRRHG